MINAGGGSDFAVKTGALKAALPAVISCQISDRSPDVMQALSKLDRIPGASESGGVSIFIGRVRRAGLCGDIRQLWLEHYTGMSERVIRDLQQNAAQRWPLTFCHVDHRVGSIAVGEAIVVVVCAAGHRKDSIAASHYLIDLLKTRVPFWKREDYMNGQQRWIEPVTSDYQAQENWASKD